MHSTEKNKVILVNSGTWGAFGCDGAWPNAYIDWLLNKVQQIIFYFCSTLTQIYVMFFAGGPGTRREELPQIYVMYFVGALENPEKELH
jgi:hypothetical protein